MHDSNVDAYLHRKSIYDMFVRLFEMIGQQTNHESSCIGMALILMRMDGLLE